MRLLNKDTPFVWDDLAQHMLNNIKHTIMYTHVLQPPNYTKEYSMYVVASVSTIGMVLVQKDEHN